ncbi:MAG TPA: hypothetical protein VIE17_08755 [Methylophilaceae bacterium]
MTESAKKTKSLTPAASKPAPAKKLTVVAKPTAKSPAIASKAKVVAVKVKKPVAKKPVAKKPEVKAAKPHKQKMVRDSFTMPSDDYAKLSMLKNKCLENGIEVKKSELIRAGLIALSKMPDKTLLSAVTGVERIKTGRPKAK